MMFGEKKTFKIFVVNTFFLKHLPKHISAYVHHSRSIHFNTFTFGLSDVKTPNNHVI